MQHIPLLFRIISHRQIQPNLLHSTNYTQPNNRASLPKFEAAQLPNSERLKFDPSVDGGHI